jgi:hypothetical protein
MSTAGEAQAMLRRRRTRCPTSAQVPTATTDGPPDIEAEFLDMTATSSALWAEHGGLQEALAAFGFSSEFLDAIGGRIRSNGATAQTCFEIGLLLGTQARSREQHG